MPAQSPDAPTPRKQTPPQTPILGKPVIKEFSTPDLRDRVIVVRRDLRAEKFEMPVQGDAFDGLDRKDLAEGYIFATAVPSDPPGIYLDLYYLKTREDQERYNMEIAFPYVDRNFPRLTRTYIVLRTDKLANGEPQADTVDTVLPNLKLTDHKIERIGDSPVLDALFVKVVRVFDKLPGPIITSFDSNQFQQRVTVKTQEIEKSDPPKLSALVEKVSQERVGTAKAKNTAASVPDVFPNTTIEKEIPDLPHEEFLAGFEFVTETIREAGQVSEPALGVGEFGKQEQQETAFIKRTQLRRQPMPQERLHRELVETLGGGIAEETIQVDTPLSALDVQEGFDILESKLRDLGSFGKVLSTTRMMMEASNIEVLDSGEGFLAPPAISFVDASGNPFALGAVAVPVMGQGVLRVDMVNDGGQYDFPPAVRFRSSDGNLPIQPAVGAALISRGVENVFITKPGQGYDVAPAVVFSGGLGSGAVATAVIGNPLNSIAVTGTGGTGYVKPVIIITGDGTGARAVVKSADIASNGRIKKITLIENGHGYTVVPTITVLDQTGPGFGATAVASLKSHQGQVVRVDMVQSGEYLSPPTVKFTGGTPTAPATAVSSLGTGHNARVKSVVVLYPGRGYTQPPIVEFFGGSTNPNIAQATGVAVLKSTYHVAAITLQTPGAFTPGSTEPIVKFTPNPVSTPASAQYFIGGYPILYGSVVDSRYGLVTQIVKRVVAAGTTWRPGLGFTEVHSHDKWRSIMVTSKPDLRSLPPPVVYPTTRNLSLPPHLEAIYPSWAKTVGHARSSTLRELDSVIVSQTLKATASVSGDITIQATRGYAGPALALVTEMFFYGPPSVDMLPTPLKIQGVYGTAQLFMETRTVSTTKDMIGTLLGESDNSSTRTATKTIGPVLTGKFIQNFELGATAVATGYGYGSPDDLRPTRGFDGTLIYPEGFIYLAPDNLDVTATASMNIAIPVSDPPEMTSGMVYLEAMQVDRLGLGIWKVALVNVYVP